MRLGWTKCVCGDPECGAWFAPGAKPDEPSLGVPDYSTDLNVIHEAVRRLRSDGNQFQWLDYTKNLFKVVWKREATSDDCVISGLSWDVIEATAEQRAEAFLKTLDRWVEDGKVAT